MSGAADSGSELLDRRRPRAVLVAMLSLTSGVTDAISFLYLGGVFTSVITGTLVVLGLSVANVSGSTVVRAVVAFAAYALGVFAARGVAALRPSPAGRDSRRLRAAIACLTGETALLAAMWASWLAVYPDPAGFGQIPPLVFAGLAMGMQGAAMRSLGHPGLATTYLTGATTELVTDIGGVGRAVTDGFCVGARTIPADDLHTGMGLQPRGDGLLGAVGQHVNRPAGGDVDDMKQPGSSLRRRHIRGSVVRRGPGPLLREGSPDAELTQLRDS